MIKPYTPSIVVLCALVAGTLVLDLAWPLLTKFLVDHVLENPSVTSDLKLPYFGTVSKKRALLMVVLCLAGIHVVRAILTGSSSVLGAKIGNSLTFDVRCRLLDKLQSLEMSFYNRQDTGSLVGRVSYDTDAILGFITQLTSGFLMQLLLVVFSFLMMLSLESRLALWAALPVPSILGGAIVYWRYLHPSFQKYWDRTSSQASSLNGILSGIRVVKAFAREEFESARFAQAAGEVREAKNVLDRKGAVFNPAMAIVFQAGGWIIWYAGGRDVLQGSVSLGTLMAFFGYLGMFYGPLGNLTNLTTWLTQFSTQMHRIIEILEAPSAIETGVKSPPERWRGEVEFRNVHFSYSRGAPVLQGLNLKIKAGESVGLVGRSGSGKTSLMNLLYRFYDPDEGEILIDGIDVREFSRAGLRRQMSLVQQEPFLFRGTFSENIAYGKLEASLKEIISAARAANCHEFVMNHPLGYETPVGERGMALSGGERQRISIARAILRKSPVLVLDEATSALDTESEASVQAALEMSHQAQTKILIAHRLSTLRSCDRICVLDLGRIVEDGTHEELIQQGGIYAEWVKRQNGSKTVLSKVDSVRWLQPDEIKLRETGGGLAVTVFGREFFDVHPRRCFPVHHPNDWISLNIILENGRREEIGILETCGPHQEMVRSFIDQRLQYDYIRRVKRIRRSQGVIEFRVKTHTGDKKFVVRDSPESIMSFGRGGRLLIDRDDSIYVISDLSELPARERRNFESTIFW